MNSLKSRIISNCTIDMSISVSPPGLLTALQPKNNAKYISLIASPA